MQKSRLQKATAIFLALTMLFGLVACQKEDGNNQLPGSYDEQGNYQPNIPDVQQKFEAAHKANTDVVAWLYMPNLKIDEAVVQTTDNDYYIRRDVKKKYDYAGCFYMDYESVMFDQGKDLAQNTIIYGHNLGDPMGVKDDPDGVKFAQLLKLNDIEIAKKTPYIFLYTPAKQHVFEIFSVMYCEALTTPIPYHYAEYTPERMELLLKDVRERSEYIYETQVSAQDKIITLSTCTYKYGTYSQNPDQRYVVLGRLVKDGEKYLEEAKLKKNENPKAPSFA